MSQTLERTVEQLARQVAGSYFGKYRGIVTDNKDPEQLCRIMAQVPAVMGETEVGWALPAFPLAGDGHGHVMMPEVGSAVWIEFEAGNLNSPIWSGGFFLANQTPPDPQGVGVRVIVSKNKHRIVLDDEADEVIVAHSSGAEITLSATEISLTVGGSSIVMGLAGIDINKGVLKIGPAGVSLAMGAMTLGVPPT